VRVNFSRLADREQGKYSEQREARVEYQRQQKLCKLSWLFVACTL